MRRRFLAPIGEKVRQIFWSGLNVPSEWQQIGAYAEPPLTGQPYSREVQRRNGVGDIAGLGNSYMVAPGVEPTQARTQQVSNVPGAQRSQLTPNGQQLGKLGVSQMQGNVRQAAVAQSGAGVLAFVKQLNSRG